MNSSRDIEKLFDHFGGNAGDYQEIGRENEAKSARTRWPLLATLDFAQPAIPEIAPRREVQLNAPHAHSHSNEASAEAASTQQAPTPILRGRQQLFMRPHRRTIPAVNPPAAESLSALRFSVMGESAPEETGTIPDSAASVAPVAPIAPVAPVTAKPEAARPAATFGSNLLAKRTPVEVPPAVPASRVAEPAAVPAASPSSSPSILGKLFKPQAQPAASAPADSLNAMFERLRHADRPSNESTNTPRANRLSRP
jgi:hypothetical protein